MSQNFKNGKIYKITNNINNEIYVGSTCDILRKRFNNHTKQITQERKKNRPLYKLMIELGTDVFRIDLIENYPCEDKQALRQREGYWIRQIATLNKQIAGRTAKEAKKEYEKTEKRIQYEQSEERKAAKIKSAKKIYEENKEKINAYRSEKILCECGLTISRGSLTRHKETKKHLDFLENSK